MRTKIGKRIGPVPIALAVFALAAVLSVGALFAVNANSIQAQGLPDTPTTEAERAGTGDDDCEVSVISATGAPMGGQVMDGGCNVSGDSADVVFENEDASANATSSAVAVYTTGGDEFNVQARDGMTDLGKKGVNEDLFDIDEAGTAIGGGSDPGSATVTVSRDMADSKGEVYLFVYHATDKLFPNAGDDDGTNTGIPFSLIKGGDTLNATTDDALETLGEDAVSTANVALDRALLAADAAGGVLLDQEDGANPRVAPHSHTLDVVTAEVATLKLAEDLIFAIKDDSDYDTQRLVTPEGQTASLGDLVDAADMAIADLKNVIGVVKGTVGSVNSFYGSSADISVKVVFRSAATLGTDITGDGAITGTEKRSTLEISRPPSKTNGEAAVVAMIQDANGTLLSGFVDFTVEGGDSVVFKESSLKTHRVELGVGDNVPDGSTGVVVVKGLSKTDPVRVKVTANYNSGELIQTVYLSRLGDATEIDATAYSCTSNVDDMDDENTALSGKACDYEIMALTADKIASNDPKELVSIGADQYFFIAGTAKDALGSSIDSLGSGNVTWKAADADARAVFVPTDGNTNTQIKIDGDAEPGTYNITVEDSGKDASATVMVTVAGDASMISVSCDPEMIPTETGLTDCTVMVRDAADNIPSNLDQDQDQVQISVRGSSDIKADLIGPIDNLINLDEQGMANFAIQMPLDAVEGTRITVNVSTSIDDELLRNHTVVTYGDAPSEPGMPMNVMAMATSHDMITVSWESPAADGGSAVTGYVLQSKTGMMDFMTIAASSAEVWWNTLDCPMMNAEIPDDATPAPPADDADMASPYCAMYAGLSAEATTVVDGVFADEYDTISGTSYSDMDLMAETTYYYRVSAINSAGKGEYSDGMAMAMTDMVTVAPFVLMAPMNARVVLNNGGTIVVGWDAVDGADGYVVIAVNSDINKITSDTVSESVNDGDDTSHGLSGLTLGQTYLVFVASFNSEGAELSELITVTAK